jgi:hypothetical protein
MFTLKFKEHLKPESDVRTLLLAVAFLMMSPPNQKEMPAVIHVRCPLLLADLNQNLRGSEIFFQTPHIKFNENPFSCSRVMCRERWTDKARYLPTAAKYFKFRG